MATVKTKTKAVEAPKVEEVMIDLDGLAIPRKGKPHGLFQAESFALTIERLVRADITPTRVVVEKVQKAAVPDGKLAFKYWAEKIREGLDGTSGNRRKWLEFIADTADRLDGEGGTSARRGVANAVAGVFDRMEDADDLMGMVDGL